MSIEKEPESLIPFIDDGAEEENLDKELNREQYNLRITRNYQNKTRRVEISKILQDVEPVTNRSLSPTAPLAYDSEHLTGDASDADGPQKGKELATAGTLTGAEFELTIKSNNSVIKIQGFDNKSTISVNSGKAKGDNVYEFLSREVDKIFKKPDRGDIERAMRSISGMKGGEKSMKCDRKMKPLCRQKRGTWKALTKSLIGMRGVKSAREQRRGSLERYPKMVLLQDIKPAEEEENYPKMVMLGDKTSREKKNFESEKDALRTESRKIEKSKCELNKSRRHLSQEKKRLKEKKEAIRDKKANTGDVKLEDEGLVRNELDIIAEEKLCMELEKQLLGEEKVMLREEMDLLKKEKEILQKEKSLLGEEINFLEEEKALFERRRLDPGDRERERFGDDIDDMLTGSLKLCPNANLPGKRRAGPTPRQHENCFHPSTFEGDDAGYSSVPPLCCQYPGHERYHCPSVYVPVYSRPFPYYQYGANEFCYSGKMEPPAAQKNSTTQTESHPPDPQLEVEPTAPPTEDPKIDKDLDLPFGIISSFFPRIVVMKSFQEEVSSDDADAKIFEIPRTETPPPGSRNEKEDEKACGEPELVQPVDFQLEGADEDAAVGVADAIEGPEERGAEEYLTGSTTEGREEELEVTADQTGEEEEEEVAGSEDFPLTKIGYSIYDKLNELAMERRREGEGGGGETEEEEEEGKQIQSETKKAAQNVTFEFSNKLMRVSLRDDNLNFQMYGSGEGDGEAGREAAMPTADTLRKCVTDDKMAVRRSELWHPSNGGRARRVGAPDKAPRELSLSVSDSQSLIFTIRFDEGAPEKRTSEAKVGTDGFDLAGGHYVCQEGTKAGDLSPRTEKALQSLRDKLGGGKRQNAERREEFKFPGLFFIHPIDSRRTFPRDDYILTKDRERKRQEKLRAPGKVREYYCEECLATMRLLEEETLSVKSIVDKFEQIIHLGSY